MRAAGGLYPSGSRQVLSLEKMLHKQIFSLHLEQLGEIVAVNVLCPETYRPDGAVEDGNS